MARHHIATTAQIGAGKGLFVKILKKLLPGVSIHSVRFSDPLREMVAYTGFEVTRENLQNLGDALRLAFKDEGILSKILHHRLKQIDADLIFLDGLRKPGEAELVWQLNGHLVYIHADQELRWRRRVSDPDNVGERNMTFAEFQELDSRPAEASIRGIGDTLANFKIENNGTVEEFEAKVREFLETIKPRLAQAPF